MIKKLILLFFFVIFITSASASNKEKIIKNLKNTKNLNFKFEQNIDGKIENGVCTIEYPKKIYCDYIKNKILVSNGKSLVIKTTSGYYRYPLEKTPFSLLLDKNFLIKKIYNLNEKIMNNNYVHYKILENGEEINIFFDKDTFDLVGWQTIDVYQNLNIIFFSSIKKNLIIEKNLFKLPLQN